MKTTLSNRKYKTRKRNLKNKPVKTRKSYPRKFIKTGGMDDFALPEQLSALQRTNVASGLDVNDLLIKIGLKKTMTQKAAAAVAYQTSKALAVGKEASKAASAAASETADTLANKASEASTVVHRTLSSFGPKEVGVASMVLGAVALGGLGYVGYQYLKDSKSSENIEFIHFPGSLLHKIKSGESHQLLGSLKAGDKKYGEDKEYFVSYQTNKISNIADYHQIIYSKTQEEGSNKRCIFIFDLEKTKNLEDIIEHETLEANSADICCEQAKADTTLLLDVIGLMEFNIQNNNDIESATFILYLGDNEGTFICPITLEKIRIMTDFTRDYEEYNFNIFGDKKCTPFGHNCNFTKAQGYLILVVPTSEYFEFRYLDSNFVTKLTNEKLEEEHDTGFYKNISTYAFQIKRKKQRIREQYTFFVENNRESSETNTKLIKQFGEDHKELIDLGKKSIQRNTIQKEERVRKTIESLYEFREREYKLRDLHEIIIIKVSYKDDLESEEEKNFYPGIRVEFMLKSFFENPFKSLWSITADDLIKEITHFNKYYDEDFFESKQGETKEMKIKEEKKYFIEQLIANKQTIFTEEGKEYLKLIEQISRVREEVKGLLGQFKDEPKDDNREDILLLLRWIMVENSYFYIDLYMSHINDDGPGFDELFYKRVKTGREGKVSKIGSLKTLLQSIYQASFFKREWKSGSSMLGPTIVKCVPTSLEKDENQLVNLYLKLEDKRNPQSKMVPKDFLGFITNRFTSDNLKHSTFETSGGGGDHIVTDNHPVDSTLETIHTGGGEHTITDNYPVHSRLETTQKGGGGLKVLLNGSDKSNKIVIIIAILALGFIIFCMIRESQKRAQNSTRDLIIELGGLEKFRQQFIQTSKESLTKLKLDFNIKEDKRKIEKISEQLKGESIFINLNNIKKDNFEIFTKFHKGKVGAKVNVGAVTTGTDTKGTPTMGAESMLSSNDDSDALQEAEKELSKFGINLPEEVKKKKDEVEELLNSMDEEDNQEESNRRSKILGTKKYLEDLLMTQLEYYSCDVELKHLPGQTKKTPFVLLIGGKNHHPLFGRREKKPPPQVVSFVTQSLDYEKKKGDQAQDSSLLKSIGKKDDSENFKYEEIIPWITRPKDNSFFNQRYVYKQDLVCNRKNLDFESKHVKYEPMDGAKKTMGEYFNTEKRWFFSDQEVLPLSNVVTKYLKEKFRYTYLDYLLNIKIRGDYVLQKNQFMLSEKTTLVEKGYKHYDDEQFRSSNQHRLILILQPESFDKQYFWILGTTSKGNMYTVYYYQYNTNPSKTSQHYNDYIHLKDIDIIGRESNNKKSSTSKRAGPTVRDFISAIQSEFGTIESVEWPSNSPIEKAVLLNRKVYPPLEEEGTEFLKEKKEEDFFKTIQILSHKLLKLYKADSLDEAKKKLKDKLEKYQQFILEGTLYIPKKKNISIEELRKEMEETSEKNIYTTLHDFNGDKTKQFKFIYKDEDNQIREGTIPFYQDETDLNKKGFPLDSTYTGGALETNQDGEKRLPVISRDGYAPLYNLVGPLGVNMPTGKFRSKALITAALRSQDYGQNSLNGAKFWNRKHAFSVINGIYKKISDLTEILKKGNMRKKSQFSSLIFEKVAVAQIESHKRSFEIFLKSSEYFPDGDGPDIWKSYKEAPKNKDKPEILNKQNFMSKIMRGYEIKLEEQRHHQVWDRQKEIANINRQFSDGENIGKLNLKEIFLNTDKNKEIRDEFHKEAKNSKEEKILTKYKKYLRISPIKAGRLSPVVTEEGRKELMSKFNKEDDYLPNIIENYNSIMEVSVIEKIAQELTKYYSQYNPEKNESFDPNEFWKWYSSLREENKSIYTGVDIKNEELWKKIIQAFHMMNKCPQFYKDLDYEKINSDCFDGSKRKVNLNSKEKLFLENVFKEMQVDIYTLIQIAEIEDNNNEINYDGLYFQDLLPKNVVSNTSFSSIRPLGRSLPNLGIQPGLFKVPLN